MKETITLRHLSHHMAGGDFPGRHPTSPQHGNSSSESHLIQEACEGIQILADDYIIPIKRLQPEHFAKAKPRKKKVLSTVRIN